MYYGNTGCGVFKRGVQNQKDFCLRITYIYVYILADLGFFLDCEYQGGVKPTVFGIFQDLKFKISEGSNQNW